MCAMRAGQRGRRVLVLDHADAPGKKILISGGGRCNFTNRDIRPERFLSANPHFSRSALAGYTAADFVALVEKHRIPFHEKTLGQLFCDGSAREIVAMLLAECAAAGVEIRLGHRVSDLSRADRFRVETDRGAFAGEGPGAGDRRPVHPEDGRHRLRAGRGAALRAEGGADPRRPRAARLRRRGAGADAPAGRRRAAGGGALRPRRLSGSDAVHPSRPVRPRHPAGVLLLARGRGRSRSTCCPAATPAACWRDGEAGAGQGGARHLLAEHLPSASGTNP
jgi:hypothetical protein